MNSKQATTPRERKKIQRLVMRDESAHPDNRFVERYADSTFVEDVAILDAWTPRLVLPVRVETTVHQVTSGRTYTSHRLVETAARR